jgi:hypothetical protein
LESLLCTLDRSKKQNSERCWALQCPTDARGSDSLLFGGGLTRLSLGPTRQSPIGEKIPAEKSILQSSCSADRAPPPPGGAPSTVYGSLFGTGQGMTKCKPTKVKFRLGNGGLVRRTILRYLGFTAYFRGIKKDQEGYKAALQGGSAVATEYATEKITKPRQSQSFSGCVNLDRGGPDPIGGVNRFPRDVERRGIAVPLLRNSLPGRTRIADSRLHPAAVFC